jgi:C-terminal processing protease CtpA/Prc
VNPTKLFETAVSAMLRSLDPYTEFENLDTAKTMQESVSGKYAGVGMVISSNKEIRIPTLPLKKDTPNTQTFSKPPPAAKQDDTDKGTGAGTGSEASPDTVGSGGSTDGQQPPSSSSSSSQPPTKKAAGSRVATGKEVGKGVTVVDAFEGFAYDAGMRVGDRILSVNGVDARRLNVEQVRAAE